MARGSGAERGPRESAAGRAKVSGPVLYVDAVVRLPVCIYMYDMIRYGIRRTDNIRLPAALHPFP